MKRLTPSEIKEMQLDILSTIADFCQRNHLRYYLYYGTLIGAIRHNGYIPWDDDVDIIMPRPDYEKFIKTFNDSSKAYKVLDDRISTGYYLDFAKVHNPKTIIESEFSKEKSFGVFVDIFPFDGVKEGLSGKIQFKSVYLLTKFRIAKEFTWWKKRTLLTNLGIYFFKAVLFAVPVTWILNGIRKIASAVPFDKSKNVGLLAEVHSTNSYVPRRCLGKGKLHVFEDRQFIIPDDYDTCLRNNYGDYMKLPPKEEQVGHPQIAYWKDEQTM